MVVNVLLFMLYGYLNYLNHKSELSYLNLGDTICKHKIECKIINYFYEFAYYYPVLSLFFSYIMIFSLFNMKCLTDYQITTAVDEQPINSKINSKKTSLLSARKTLSISMFSSNNSPKSPTYIEDLSSLDSNTDSFLNKKISLDINNDDDTKIILQKLKENDKLINEIRNTMLKYISYY